MHREVESERSRRQSAGQANRNRIEAAMPLNKANIFKVRILSEEHGRRCGRYKREDKRAFSGEAWLTCIKPPAPNSTRMGWQKSAETIVPVDGSHYRRVRAEPAPSCRPNFLSSWVEASKEGLKADRPADARQRG